MKNLLFKTFLFCLLTAVSVGCDLVPGLGNEGETGDFKLEVKTVGADYIELNVTAPAEVEMAYCILTEPKLMTPPVLFLTGDKETVKPGVPIRLKNVLQSGTEYILYAAARLDSKNYSEMVQIEFVTESYKFDRLLTLMDTYYDGYKIHFTLPEETKKNGHVVRYNMVDQAMYNVLIANAGDETYHILESVVMNGYRYGKFVKNDSTCIFNHGNQVMVDEKGDPIEDKDGDYIDIHLPSAPGEPTVFIAGECRLGTDDEMGELLLGKYYGTPNSLTYQVPIFDWNTVDPEFDWDNTDRDSWAGSGWTGAFQKLVFKTKAPGVCEPTVNIDIPEAEIGVTDAMIYFEMEEGVSRYVYAILDNGTYNSAIDLFLDKTGAPEAEIDEAFQWFLTSYTAYQQLGIEGKEESTMVNAASHFTNNVLEGGTVYHVVCTVMVDDPSITENPENGAYQKYIHKTFKAREKTKKPPVIEVKAVGSDPYLAVFNLKAPNKDLVGANWACNYAREFELMLNTTTYENLVSSNVQQKLTNEEIQAINSDEGYNVSFGILDGEVLRYAIYGYNDEYTFNRFDLKAGLGCADYEAPMAPSVAKIESPLYEALEGDWTATATIKVNEKQEDGSYISRNMTYKSKVTISNDIQGLPETLEEYVYGLYKGESVEEVDGMYSELLDLADRFAESRLEGQNRMLCTGFIDFDYYEDKSRIDYMSPYDLFTSTDYSSYDVPQLIYDFGPKWFLQIQADGSVIVPMNSTSLPPMHAWGGYPYYVGAYGVSADGTPYAFYNSSDTVKGFPVEISSDYKKVTVKPIVLSDGSKYYMNAIGLNPQSVASGTVEIVATVLTELVLTRGWTDTKSMTENAFAAVPSKVRAATIDGKPVDSIPERVVVRSLTELKPQPAKNFNLDENPNVVTRDMLDTAVERICKMYGVK